MIFKEIIYEKGKLLNPVFDQLFELTIKNQIHSGDLLVVNENGFYYPEALYENNLGMNFLPYTIGSDNYDFSEQDHYKFIDYYRQTFECRMSYEEYLTEIKWEPGKREKIDKFIFHEELSIQLEMLIYLKIWESDSFIKRIYQLARLSNGEEYDWHFKIAESSRDKYSIGTRQKILREKVRDKFRQTLPCLYSSFNKSYNTQVRNSIAHSKYSFLNRYIHLNNFIDGDKSSQLRSISFDYWIDIFHETMILYNGYIRFFNKVNSYYAEIAKRTDNLIEVKLNMKLPKQRVEYMYMEYRPDWNDFKLKLD